MCAFERVADGELGFEQRRPRAPGFAGIPDREEGTVRRRGFGPEIVLRACQRQGACRAEDEGESNRRAKKRRSEHRRRAPSRGDRGSGRDGRVADRLAATVAHVYAVSASGPRGPPIRRSFCGKWHPNGERPRSRSVRRLALLGWTQRRGERGASPSAIGRGAEIRREIVEHDRFVLAEGRETLGSLHPADQRDPAISVGAILGHQASRMAASAMKADLIEARGDREAGGAVVFRGVGAESRNRAEEQCEAERGAKGGHARRIAMR